MEHRELEELLTPYLLGDTTPTETDEVADHLKDCESCRALAQELELTLDLLCDALAADAPPPRLSPAQREAVYRSRRPAWITWSHEHRRGLGYAAAAAMVMALLSAMLLPMSRPAGVGTRGGARMELAQVLDETPAPDSVEHAVGQSSEDAEVPALKPMTTVAPAESKLREIYQVPEDPQTDPWDENGRVAVKETQDSFGAFGDSGSAGGAAPLGRMSRRTAALTPSPNRQSKASSRDELSGEEFQALRTGVMVTESAGEDSVPRNMYYRGGAPTGAEPMRGRLDGDDKISLGTTPAAAVTMVVEPASVELSAGDVLEGVAAGGYITSGSASVEKLTDLSRDNDWAMDGEWKLAAEIEAEPEREGEERYAHYSLTRFDVDGAVADPASTRDAGKAPGKKAFGQEALGKDVRADFLYAEPNMVEKGFEILGQGLAGDLAGRGLGETGAGGSSSLSYGFAEQDADGVTEDFARTAWADRTGGALEIESRARIAESRKLLADVVPATDAPESVAVLGDVPLTGSLFRFEDGRNSEESSGGRTVFLGYGVNPYRVVAREPISTFGIDVDTASYTLARRYLEQGSRPPPDAVRTEEFVNFFDYDHRPPVARTFATHVSGAPAPFGEGVLMKISVKAKRLGRDDQKPSVLTFVVDTSGSMDTDDRLGLVKTSLHLLVGELAPADRVAIVQVDSDARLVLEHTPAEKADAIRAAIDGLQCSGSTHLAAGIELGYDVAARGFVGGAVNRVLILSDGAANLGSANPGEILARVEASRAQGIVSSVFGFGLGTYNDAMLETLANRGDGTYHFIDSSDEARRVFVDELSAALHGVARDVKIQVEFDPARVAQYRQLGYENRQLKTEDFRDDAVDAGEVGSGQSVTALYELILTEETRGRLGVVRVRYRDEQTGMIEETARDLRAEDLVASIEDTRPQFRLAACTAEFAELLRHSPFAADGSFDAVAAMLRPIAMELHLDQRVRELLDLVERAGSLPAHSPNP